MSTDNSIIRGGTMCNYPACFEQMQTGPLRFRHKSEHVLILAIGWRKGVP